MNIEYNTEYIYIYYTKYKIYNIRCSVWKPGKNLKKPADMVQASYQNDSWTPPIRGVPGASSL